MPKPVESQPSGEHPARADLPRLVLNNDQAAYSSRVAPPLPGLPGKADTVRPMFDQAPNDAESTPPDGPAPELTESAVWPGRREHIRQRLPGTNKGATPNRWVVVLC